MGIRSYATVALAAGALAGTAPAATVVNGAPDISRYRGTPVAIMFFHPL